MTVKLAHKLLECPSVFMNDLTEAQGTRANLNTNLQLLFLSLSQLQVKCCLGVSFNFCKVPNWLRGPLKAFQCIISF